MNRGKEKLKYLLSIGFFGVCLFYIEPLSEPPTDIFFFNSLAQFSLNLPFQNNCMGVRNSNTHIL